MSGASRADVQNVKEELNKYAFLEWITPYVALKDLISNLDVSCGSGDAGNVINDEPDEKLAEEESDIDGAEEKEENGDPDGDKVEPELEGRQRLQQNQSSLKLPKKSVNGRRQKFLQMI